MLKIKDIYESVILCENKSKHIFDDGHLTFADIRDIANNIFNGGIMISKKVPSINLLITYKDGQFCIQTDLKKLNKPCCYSDFSDKCCTGGEDVKKSFRNSIRNIIDSLSELDPVLLNKYFANGQNYMDCQIVYPPEGQCQNYQNRCFINLNKLKCFDKNFKEIGSDDESAEELFNELRCNDHLAYENAEICQPNLQKIKNSINRKRVIDNIMFKLKTFINGVGWNCTLDSYIQDRYSRYIINKALEYGLDVSRNSSFVNELVSRLSGTSNSRPTKSDLITFAKREGIDCHSDNYISFLDDIESNSQQTNNEIISPIENLIYYIVSMALKDIMTYMALDPNQKTQKFLSGLDCSYCDICENDEISYCNDKHDSIKKNLSKINQYVEMLPKNIVIMYKRTPYSITSTLGKLQNLCKIIKFN